MPVMEPVKPTIHIMAASGASMEWLRELQYGMEEEGVPYETDTKSDCGAVALAWEAANASRLGVGVGLDAQSVVLHYAKLHPENPLFRLSIRGDRGLARRLGSNAARLVKKLPLKSLDGR